VLRSLEALHRYGVLAKDGDIGKVHDFYFHDDNWIIRYLVVQTGQWPTARKVLISPQWLGEIRYTEREVTVTLTRDKILRCPEFLPGAPVNREYEERLYDYYGRPVYWEDADAAAAK
jgi:PRC-barrel domain